MPSREQKLGARGNQALLQHSLALNKFLSVLVVTINRYRKMVIEGMDRQVGRLEGRQAGR